MDSENVFKELAEELSSIWNYSHIPLILEQDTFSELRRANELALKIIAHQYKEGHYENRDHPFTRKVSALPDPEVSIVPFRIDYLKNEKGTYAMYDLNTQPGVPGSFFWEDYWRSHGNMGAKIDGNDVKYFRFFPVLGSILKDLADTDGRVAQYQAPDPMMGGATIKGLSTICGKISSYGHYGIDFIMDEKRLEDYNIIEPFFFIRGDMSRVFANYATALKTGKPLASNLKLEPYTSKDMAFANNMDSYLGSADAGFLKERVAWPLDGDGVKKRLYGMSGTGYYDGDDRIPWSDELVCQERLYPEMCDVSRNGGNTPMMYDIGITSLMVFRGRDLVRFDPVVDITVRAKKTHPISGPDTNVVPAAVEQ